MESIFGMLKCEFLCLANSTVSMSLKRGGGDTYATTTIREWPEPRGIQDSSNAESSDHHRVDGIDSALIFMGLLGTLGLGTAR